jgi:hypothetical protein
MLYQASRPTLVCRHNPTRSNRERSLEKGGAIVGLKTTSAGRPL